MPVTHSYVDTGRNWLEPFGDFVLPDFVWNAIEPNAIKPETEIETIRTS